MTVARRGEARGGFREALGAYRGLFGDGGSQDAAADAFPRPRPGCRFAVAELASVGAPGRAQRTPARGVAFSHGAPAHRIRGGRVGNGSVALGAWLHVTGRS